MEYLFSFFIGSIFGSFIAVILYRRPKNIKYVFGRSKCESCNYTIPYYYNIPIISFLILKGKCKNCNVKINYNNLFYEILCGVVSLYIFNIYGLSFNYILRFFQMLIIVLIIFSDILEKDIYIIDMFLLFIIEFIYKIYNNNLNINNLKYALIFFFIMLLLYILTKSIGMGDVILSFVIGFFFDNIYYVFLIFRMSFVLGAIVSIVLILSKKKTKKDYIAFSPYLLISLLYYL